MKQLSDLKITDFFLNKYYKKVSYGNIKKSRKNKKSNKPKREDTKYFLTVHLLTETTQNCAKFHRFATSHSFNNYFLLISKKGTVQWLNCTYLKYELNHSYNGGKVVYLLKVRHLDHPTSRCLPRSWVEVKMWKRRWRNRLGGCDSLDEGSARIFLTLGQVNPSVSLF